MESALYNFHVIKETAYHEKLLLELFQNHIFYTKVNVDYETLKKNRESRACFRDNQLFLEGCARHFELNFRRF